MVPPASSPYVDVSMSAGPYTNGTSATRAGRHILDVVDPEPEVMDAELVELLRVAVDAWGDLLVEHDERRVGIVAPLQVPAAATHRRVPSDAPNSSMSSKRTSRPMRSR